MGIEGKSTVLMKKLTVATAAVAMLLAGCSETKSDAPEPSPDNIVNGTNTQVIRLPDGFRNVAFTCYGVNGVYVTSRGAFQTGNDSAIPLASGIFVIENDSHCRR